MMAKYKRKGEMAIKSIMRICNILKRIMLLSLLGVSSANALPVAYNESINGDLNDGLLGTDLGVFELGTNTVTGTMQPFAGDFDAFTFTILPGYGISDFYYDYSTAPAENSYVRLGLWDPAGSNLGAALLGSWNLSSDDTDGFVRPLRLIGPIGAGSYTVRIGGYGGQGGFSSPISYSATIKIVEGVPEPVPEPSIAILLSSGLIVFGLMRRKSIA